MLNAEQENEFMENGKIKEKIYITALHMKHGGVELVIASLANAFAELGHEVEILCTYDFGEVAYHIDPAVKITYLTGVLPNRKKLEDALRGGKLFSAVKEVFYAMKVLRLKKSTMRSAIEKIDSGIIISTRNEHSVLLSKYGREEVMKIAQLHHDHKFDKELIRDFAEGYGNIDYFTILTPKLCGEIKEFMKGNTHTKCVNIPNFIQSEPIERDLPPKKQVIAAGRLHPDKDFHALLRVWKTVSERCGEYTLKICGEGDMLDALRDYADSLEIADSVEFCGALPHGELLKEMSQSICYAMTSATECFPLVLLESMYCGLPPVAFDVRVGLDAIISDGTDGYLIKGRDEDAMAEKIISLIENGGERARLSENCAAKAEGFSKENVMKMWLDIIDEWRSK